MLYFGYFQHLWEFFWWELFGFDPRGVLEMKFFFLVEGRLSKIREKISGEKREFLRKTWNLGKSWRKVAAQEGNLDIKVDFCLNFSPKTFPGASLWDLKSQFWILNPNFGSAILILGFFLDSQEVRKIPGSWNAFLGKGLGVGNTINASEFHRILG